MKRWSQLCVVHIGRLSLRGVGDGKRDHDATAWQEVQLVTRIWRETHGRCCGGEWRYSNEIVAVEKIVDGESNFTSPKPGRILDRIVDEHVGDVEGINLDSLVHRVRHC